MKELKLKSYDINKRAPIQMKAREGDDGRQLIKLSEGYADLHGVPVELQLHPQWCLVIYPSIETVCVLGKDIEE